MIHTLLFEEEKSTIGPDVAESRNNSFIWAPNGFDFAFTTSACLRKTVLIRTETLLDPFLKMLAKATNHEIASYITHTQTCTMTARTQMK
jgi:hypothetical protein